MKKEHCATCDKVSDLNFKTFDENRYIITQVWLKCAQCGQMHSLWGDVDITINPYSIEERVKGLGI